MIAEIVTVAGISFCVLALLAGARVNNRRQAAFRNRYSSYEDFRRQVDAERIRDLRRKWGDVYAIKAVRQAHPGASLVMAKRYVDELPG